MLMVKYRLAIDLGSTSLGWAAYCLDETAEPCALHRIGSYIFSDGRQEKATHH